MSRRITKLAEALGATIVAKVQRTGGGAFGAARLSQIVAGLQAELTPPALAAEWAAEVNRRINAYDRGETPADDAATAIAKMRREFTERQAKDN